MKSRWLIALACSMLGCGGNASEQAGSSDGGTGDAGAQAPSIAEICDGSKGIRFDYRLTCNDSQFETGSEFLRKNGDSYLLIYGNCSYTAMSKEWQVVQGVLSENDAKRLAEDTLYGQWAAVAGYWPGAGIHACSTEFVDAEGARVVCKGGCDQDERAAIPRQMHSKILDWVNMLWERGVPVSGPLRIAAVEETGVPENGFSDAFRPEPWTLSFPFSSFASRTDEPQSVDPIGLLVEKDSDVQLLRELRSRARGGEVNSYKNYGTIIVSDDIPGWKDGPIYWLFIRDVAPEEDELGILPRLR